MTRRTLALPAVVAALLLAGPLATPARADFHVLRSSPAAGSAVVQPPDEVRITFDQPVNDVASMVQVSAGDGSYNAGVVTVTGGTTLVQPVRHLSPGDYSVQWSAAAGPGAPATAGTFRFTVAAPPEPSVGVGQWLVVLVMAAVVALLGTTLIRRRLARRAGKP